jgi:undecaprenyl diphosphate synthase
MSLAPVTAVRDIPKHVAIIMDGNGRWARAHGVPRTLGHRQGAESVRRAIEAAIELGISYLTLFGFSSENWQRPAEEVRDLMGLLRRYLQSELAEIRKNDIRLRFVGDLTRLPPDIVATIREAEASTETGTALNLTIALSYGGRQEIVSAARRLAERARSGEIDPAAIDEQLFERELLTLGLPDPDLMIRTSGEQRISNFLLWQSAYSELVFVDKYWPDFGKEDLEAAIEEFSRRDRRYGARPDSK